KVLKDVYLFNTDAAKVQSATQEVGDWDKKVADGLARLTASPVLDGDDRALVTTALAAQKEYQAASNAAVARATAGGDPYEAQQGAAGLTKGKDRPVATA